MTAALALPILVAPARAAAEGNEIGFDLLGYKERGLMKVTEPVLWARGTINEVWDVEASAAVDIITGASPRLVSNPNGGPPVQTVSGASINDRRNTAEIRVARHLGDWTFAASRAVSDEEDYNSKSFGLEARWDLNEKNTTLIAGYGKSNDRVGSSDNPDLHEPRYTQEYMVGITQLLSPVDLIQSTVSWARGDGYYNDPYKFTITFYPDGVLAAPDTRPNHRDTVAWLTRYRRHFVDANGSLQADYRYYHDDWGITAHTLEVGWQQTLSDRWEVRPGLRYYTQNAADFYSPVIPRPQPAILSSDQRLGTYGGLSPTIRLIAHLDHDWRVEGTLGYVQNAANFHWGGSGSPAFSTLRAVYGILGISRPF
jgi:Protein of unknown function (DUF3570)